MDEGVFTGAGNRVLPQDETDPMGLWVKLAEKHSVDLVLCISSALKRGLLDDTEAARHEKTGATVHPVFTISGLGQLVDAAAASDRLVTFGGRS